MELKMRIAPIAFSLIFLAINVEAGKTKTEPQISKEVQARLRNMMQMQKNMQNFNQLNSSHPQTIFNKSKQKSDRNQKANQKQTKTQKNSESI